MPDDWGKCYSVEARESEVRLYALRLRVAGVMDFHALRQQPLASALTTPREGGAPRFRAHARAKTVLILSGALGALKCSFHGVAC